MEDWEDMTPERRIEYMGFLYFNRHGEEDWLDYNCLYEENENLTIREDEEKY